MLRRGIIACDSLPGSGAGRIIRRPFNATVRTACPGAKSLDFTADDTAELEAELGRLKQEHRDLDTAIEALENMVTGDQLQIQRLKKRKLFLKDRIIKLEDQLTPDIIA
jgi:hypothetical protein